MHCVHDCLPVHSYPTHRLHVRSAHLCLDYPHPHSHSFVVYNSRRTPSPSPPSSSSSTTQSELGGLTASNASKSAHTSHVDTGVL